MNSGKLSYQPFQVHHLSHDLRDMINSILGFTELLLDGVEGPLNEVQTEDVTAIRQSAQRLYHLVNTLVDLGKIDAGQLKLNMETFDLSPLVQEIVARHRDSAADVTCAFPEFRPLVLADRMRVADIIQSLLAYLLKKNKAARITITVTQSESQLVTQIASRDGIVSEEDLAYLFRPAVRVDSFGRSRLAEGGLTLPLSYKLAVIQQGDLTVNSDPERGLVFTLTLPACHSRSQQTL